MYSKYPSMKGKTSREEWYKARNVAEAAEVGKESQDNAAESCLFYMKESSNHVSHRFKLGHDICM